MSSKRLAHRKGVVSGGARVNSASNSLDWDSPSAKTGTVKRRPASSDCSSTSDNDILYLNNPPPNDDFYVRPKIPIITVNHRGKYKKPGASAITYANLSLHDSIHSCGSNKFASSKVERRKRTGKISDSDSGIASPLSPSSSSYALLVYADVNCDGYEEERAEWNLKFEWLENCSCVKQQVQVISCACTWVELFPSAWFSHVDNKLKRETVFVWNISNVSRC